MSRVSKYIFSNFLSTFSSLFFTLFLIISIIFFIQISRLTAYIEVSFFELSKLYLFMLPRILLFCVPIAYFVALTMSLFRLSKENETTVLFTLGYSPKLLARFFLLLSSAISAVLLVVALVLIPTASELNTNFIDYKKNVAKLNLKPSEFGQKFSDWMVFISSQSKDGNTDTYNDITMYNGADLLIAAKKARIINEGGTALLQLENGELYRFSDEIITTNFKQLNIRSELGNTTLEGVNITKYWAKVTTSQKRRSDLSTYTLIALFPLASTLFGISLGVITQRYERGMVYVGVFGVLFTYFALIMSLGNRPQIAIPATFMLFIIAGSVMFKKRILKRY
ncbi:LptF/LptG family permease [Campylobacter sp. 19-13652]|uniref:LptF/LptG family permease n=1 Tax=Campylobacter sp. 19-13652 TaxID=2840180 RepID=UPI001C786735|nr:LptF/LptG family permease [Campylobacter sp. 19-13652]BCX79439.1 membrane protein [Campylobacter sp. 19-13652]